MFGWIFHQALDADGLRLILTLTCLLLPGLPIGLHLLNGWHAKKQEMVGHFDEDTAVAYFKKFCPNEKIPEGKACEELELRYDRNLGRRLYYLPLLVLTIVMFLAAWAVTGEAMLTTRILKEAKFTVSGPALAAAVGAYMWITSDLILRMKRRDLGPHDLMYSALRMIIAIPLGQAFAAVAAPALAPFISFALGAFPLDPLIIILRRLTMQKLGIEDKAEEADALLTKLAGVNKEIADRFGHIDIFTILQLKEADPVSCARRTNLSFNFVLECISQAIAWRYFKEKLDILRQYGMPAAYEIGSFIGELDYAETTDQKKVAAKVRAKVILTEIAKKLDLSETALENTMREVADDPYTIFLKQVYR